MGSNQAFPLKDSIVVLLIMLPASGRLQLNTPASCSHLSCAHPQPASQTSNEGNITAKWNWKGGTYWTLGSSLQAAPVGQKERERERVTQVAKARNEIKDIAEIFPVASIGGMNLGLVPEPVCLASFPQGLRA